MTEEKKNSNNRTGCLIAFAVIIVVVLIVALTGDSDTPASSTSARSARVGYFLTDMDSNLTQSCISITYTGANGESVTERNKSLPWEKIVTIQSNEEYINVSCSASFTESSLVRLQIASDGESQGFAWSDDDQPSTRVDMNSRIDIN